jgi:esterase
MFKHLYHNYASPQILKLKLTHSNKKTISNLEICSSSYSNLQKRKDFRLGENNSVLKIKNFNTHNKIFNCNKIQSCNDGFYKRSFKKFNSSSQSELNQNRKKLQTDSNSVRLNYSFVEANSENTNKVLIFLHGLFGNSNNWRSISYSSAIRDRRRSLLVDLRNHGDSDHHIDMTYPEMAQDLARLMDHLKIEKCTLLGHSMGGKIAMNFATLYPERLDGLLIIDSAPKDHRDSPNIYGGTKKIVEQVSELNIHDQSRKEVLNNLKNMFNGSVANLLNTNLTYISPEDDKVTWRCNMKAIRKNIDNIIGFESTPGKYYNGDLSIIVGEKSHTFPLDVYRTIFPKIGEGSIKRVKDAGHWVHVDNPTQVIVNIVKFLDEIDK